MSVSAGAANQKSYAQVVESSCSNPSKLQSEQGSGWGGRPPRPMTPSPTSIPDPKRPHHPGGPRRRGRLDYQGRVPSHSGEEYSPDVLARRAGYKATMAELYRQGLKPALLFPRAPGFA
ncbi:hypothetical protein CRENBAI_023234 [Crenichthys baileyi]|uniref:Uncharacterized protein n=1 Tax=Crenichthys baileyi TaxID=28760 RepID=A0AAV9RI02_9TELE